VVETEQIHITIIALIKVFPPSENEPAFAARAAEKIAVKENDSSITRVLAGSEEEKGEMGNY